MDRPSATLDFVGARGMRRFAHVRLRSAVQSNGFRRHSWLFQFMTLTTLWIVLRPDRLGHASNLQLGLPLGNGQVKVRTSPNLSPDCNDSIAIIDLRLRISAGISASRWTTPWRAERIEI